MRAASYFLFACLFGSSLGLAQEFKITKQEDGLTINVDGKLFARYLTNGHKKPVIWPIVGPTGKEMTRAYPFKSDTVDEKHDHVHHESMWFNHGNVNGTDFWLSNEKVGVIQHREFIKTEEGKTALLVTKNDWIAAGKKVCEDTRLLRFGADAKSRWIDFEVEVVASEGDLKFGDTKEGSFGLRVPTSMDVDSKKGGLIENSEGQFDAAAWGKPAKWVDYSGPVGDERLGIAILNHPSSFRFPTTWHVRTYGLFAANPFAAKDFSADSEKYGAHTIAAGEKMRLGYRVVFHAGDAKIGEVEKAFAAYSATKLGQP